MSKPFVIEVPEGYEALGSVFARALAHAAKGKGVERHGVTAEGKDIPFANQHIMHGTRTFGVGGPLFQASKKIAEAPVLLSRGNKDGFDAELLGAINYTAAALIGGKDDA